MNPPLIRKAKLFWVRLHAAQMAQLAIQTNHPQVYRVAEHLSRKAFK